MNDWKQLQAFAEAVHVVTYEFENVPLPTVNFVAGHRPFYPKANALEFTQNPWVEKRFFRSRGMRTVHAEAALNNAIILTKAEDDRASAIAQIKTALREIVIDGIKTNIPLHQDIMTDSGFIQSGQNIHYLERKLGIG